MVMPLASVRCATVAARVAALAHSKDKAMNPDRIRKYVVNMVMGEPATNRIELRSLVVVNSHCEHRCDSVRVC